MKKYVGNIKKCMENNKDSPYIWAVGLGKISSSSSYLGGRGSQFPGLGVPQRKDIMKHVKYEENMKKISSRELSKLRAIEV